VRTRAERRFFRRKERDYVEKTKRSVHVMCKIDKPFELRQGVPSWFKRERNRKMRAQAKDAMVKRRELPVFKKDNEWNWW
jgi:hypothetical protein